MPGAAKPRTARSKAEKRRSDTRLPAGPLTVSRPELLVDGSEFEFRAFIHVFLAYIGRLEGVREDFAHMIGVSGIQYEILMAIRFEGERRDVTVGDVANYLHRSGAFITIETGKLTRLGWIEKTPSADDRRKVLLKLTEKSIDRLAALAPTQRRINDVLFEAIEEGQLVSLKRLFERLVVCGDEATALIRLLRREAEQKESEPPA